MHWKGWNLAVRTPLLAGAFLTTLALTDTLTLCSAFTFASTILGPFRPGRGACTISLRHLNHLFSQKSFLNCRRTKKADAAWHPRVLNHVGLLVNGPPGTAGLPFI